MRTNDRLADQGAGSARSESLFDMKVAIAMLTLEGNEKIARADFARVKSDAADRKIGAGRSVRRFRDRS